MSLASERYQRVRELFHATCEREEADRCAFLDEACGEDDELRAEVESLLAHDQERSGPPRDFESGIGLGLLAKTAAIDGAGVLPERIGRFRIKRVLASGGMGTVYEAVQEHPRRVVAVKVMRLGVLSQSALRRFEYESQILACLRHAGIAQVYEAGTHGGAGGVPYFAMEYIPGARTITEYAEDKRLSTRQRLELFTKVCEAVQHGHQRGIVHRDLKPGNILVDETGQPKIIDFGIARVTDADMAIATLQTDVGQLVGTLQYMSPEQCAGIPTEVDTRCDVYALGVVLYELLTGELPYDVSSSSPFEAPRVIREQEPRRPSSISRNLRGDLETIVLKALEKEKTRRYQSAGELAADIRRYERGEPIEAKRDSAFYVLGKTLRRHRGLVAGATLVVVLVAAFGIVSLIQAERNRRLANQADATSTRLRRELTTSNIERGRLFGQGGHLGAAERLIWSEHLQHPRSKHSFWALWELYSRSPTLAAVTTDHAMRAVAYAPDGKLIAGAHNGGAVSLWDTTTLRRATTLRGHADTACGLDFSPDGRSLASASFDETLIIWDLTSGEAVHTLPGHRLGARVVRYSPDGKYLVSGGCDPVMRIWDAATGHCVGVLEGHTGAVIRLRFNREGTLLASGSSDCTIKLWRGLTGPAIATISGHTKGLYALVFSPDERALVSGSSDKTIKFWDLTTYECTDTIAGANGSIRFLSFTPDGETLIVGGWWRIDAWDLPTRTRRQLQAHGVTDCAPSADISPDRRLVATYYDGSLRVADVGADGGLLRLGGRSGRGKVALSPDGRVIASGNASGHVALWETATGQLLATLPPHTTHASSNHFDPTGTLLATCYADGLVKLWDLTTGELVIGFDGNHTATRHSLCFAPSGQTLAATRPDGTIQLREVSTCRVITTLPSLSSELLSVRYSPDGNTLAATYRGGEVRLFSGMGEPKAELSTVGTPWTVAFRPDGKKLAVACWWTDPIQIWDLTTYEQELCLKEPQAVVWELAYLPTDPTLIASASSDGAVRLWDLQEQRNVLTLEPFGDFDAHSPSFAPDGKTLLAAGADGSLCVWDLEYFERHMAGNLHHQIEALRPELGDAIQAEALGAWAAEVLRRPWPRVGPHAQRRARQLDVASEVRGADPEVIAAWGHARAPE
jgi:WD40 repeat protein/tRNA A-37 threonylcarbamoyl transferase component Bud32